MLTSGIRLINRHIVSNLEHSYAYHIKGKLLIFSRNNAVSMYRSYMDCTGKQPQSYKRTEDVVHFYSKHVAQLLECAPSSALVIIRGNMKILKMQPEDIQKNVDVLKTHFSCSEIRQHPQLLSVSNMHLLEHQVQVLKELGLSSVTLRNVEDTKTLLQMTVKTLKEFRMLEEGHEPLESVLEYLDCPKHVLTSIKSSQSFVNAKNCSITSIRESIIAHYLLWKFNSVLGTLNPKILLRTKYLSIQYLVEVIRCLMEDFGFSLEKVHSFKSLLHLTPHHLNDILTNIPVLAGEDIKVLAKEYPRLLFVSSQDLKATEKVLLDHGITRSQMQACLAIFKLKPRQVQYRLGILSNIKGFETWSKTLYFLWIVLHLDATQDHLKYLEKENSTISLDALATRIGLSARNRSSSYSALRKAKQALTILASVLKKSEAQIKENLSQHPKVCNLSSSNTKRVVGLLMEFGVTEEQLWSGLPLVLYDCDTVQEQLQLLPRCAEAQPFEFWKDHPNFLQLVIYCLEKQYGFTGDAVYFGCVKEPMINKTV